MKKIKRVNCWGRYDFAELGQENISVEEFMALTI